MTEETTPSVEEIKARLKVEVPVEEEEVTKAEAQNPNVTEELREFGKQFADTIRSAWNSTERQRLETELRDGMRSFADEVDKAIQEIKKSPAAERVKTEAVNVREKVEASDVGNKARAGVASGLQALSEQLAKLAERFTPAEKPVSEEETAE
ncbi:MAG: hypothetical protein H6654_06730 [Ardenticatenaceae bacterium]|nr:hypothetical protein [Anaerolineales bacterium]MCB8942005.1 hypothetical protein [Ardenticatenaceae bacterium]MCB8973235.1 hypothetical protein [Ardenticatenaceae bacterium]